MSEESYTLHLPDGYVPPPLPGRDEWIAALRGGNYEQGNKYLCRYQHYCCLGVLCEIQGRPKSGNALKYFDGSDQFLKPQNPLYNALGSGGTFPQGVVVGYFMPRYTLAECNDNGLNFGQIADIIEAVWAEPEGRAES